MIVSFKIMFIHNEFPMGSIGCHYNTIFVTMNMCEYIK